MPESFGKLVDGINPAATTLTEWFSFLAGHEYQGYVRVVNIGASDATFRIAGVSGTGVAVVSADYEGHTTDLEVGTIIDLTFDLGELETLSVWASTANVTFNYRGLDLSA